MDLKVQAILLIMNLPAMRHYLKALVIAIVAFNTAYLLIPTINVGKDPNNIPIIIGGLLLVSLLINPIFALILLPVNHLTFGSVSFVLNSALIYLMTIYLPGFNINPYDFRGINIEGLIIQPYKFNELATIILVAAIITLTQKTLRIIFQ